MQNMGSPVASTFAQLQHSAIFFSFSIAIMGCVTKSDRLISLCNYNKAHFLLKWQQQWLLIIIILFGSVDQDYRYKLLKTDDYGWPLSWVYSKQSHDHNQFIVCSVRTITSVAVHNVFWCYTPQQPSSSSVWHSDTMTVTTQQDDTIICWQGHSQMRCLTNDTIWWDKATCWRWHSTTCY